MNESEIPDTVTIEMDVTTEWMISRELEEVAKEEVDSVGELFDAIEEGHDGNKEFEDALEEALAPRMEDRILEYDIAVRGSRSTTPSLSQGDDEVRP